MPLPPQQPVYLIDGARTPFSRQLRKSASGDTVYSSQDLIHSTARALLSRHAIDTGQIDEIVMASSNQMDCANLAVKAAQRLRCASLLSPQTFLGNEQAGLQALSYACQAISSQQKSLVLLGGVETTTAPVISMSEELSEWLQAWKNASGAAAKTKVFNTLHTRYFTQREHPINTSEALFLKRQQQVEAIAHQYSISLEAQAEYVNLSQRRLKYAQRNNTLYHIAPVYYPDGSSCSTDENLVTLDLESLKHPIQTNPAAAGLITHSSVVQPTEGASCLLLASQAFIDQNKVTPLAKITAPVWETGTLSIKNTLSHHNLTISDVDYWEWDETSAAEILALKQEPIFQSLSSFDRINLDGGALSLGSPKAANQLRNILQLSHSLKRNNGQYGLSHFGFIDNKSSAVLVHNTEHTNT